MGDGDDLDINNIQNEAATEYNPEAVTTEGQRRVVAAEAAARRARARIVYSASAFERAGKEKNGVNLKSVNQVNLKSVNQVNLNLTEQNAK
jgi:hypothetical protein